MGQLELWSEMGRVGAAAPDPALAELGRRLPAAVYLGTSTWSFPGWSGLVYDRRWPRERLAREGLAAYARHPLLSCAGVDRSYYGLPSRQDLSAYAAAVPQAFRFLVKAPRACTDPEPAGQGVAGAFLDPDFAAARFVAPLVDALGSRCGPLVFQFSPGRGPGAAEFADRLGGFLAALPAGPLYAVEIRRRDWLTPAFADALAAAKACPCLSVHPSMPDLDQQARATRAASAPALVVRWNLGGQRRYDAARRRYEPFDRIVDPDPVRREQLARLCAGFAAQGKESFVTVNNKAEGCAPLSVRHLAERICETCED